MGSPRRSRPSNLHCTEGSKNMRPGSVVMEPFIVSSPSKVDSNEIHQASDDSTSTSISASASNQGSLVTTEKAPNETLPSTCLAETSSNTAAGSSMMNMDTNTNTNTNTAALHDGLRSTDRIRSPVGSGKTKKPPFLARMSGKKSAKHRKKAKEQQQRQQQKEFRQQQQPLLQQEQQQITEGRHPEETTSSEIQNAGMIASASAPDFKSMVPSPASAVHTNNKSISKRKRSSIKFLKRALSSPPILLQRFHSTPVEKDPVSDDSRIPHAGSSSSSGTSVELNHNLAERTKVVPKIFTPTSKKRTARSSAFGVDRTKDEEEGETTAVKKASCNATSILHHSYLPVLETLCGLPHLDTSMDVSFDSHQNQKQVLPDHQRDDLRDRYYNQHGNSDPNSSHLSLNVSSLSIPEDPTVQESIECIFASQLEDGLKLWDEEYDDEDHQTNPKTNGNGSLLGSPCHLQGHRSFETLEKVRTSSSDLVSPAAVQQSRMNRKDSSKALMANMSQTKKRYEQASLVYVGTFDPSTPKNCGHPNHNNTSNCNISYDRTCNSKTAAPNTSVDASHDSSAAYSNLPADPLPCSCATSFLPSVGPRDWPQAPIALRPTPGRGTKIKAIRFCGSTDPLWVPGSHLTWDQRLEQHWGRRTLDSQNKPHYSCCEKCVILPINNGNEAPGESLVIDFESELFEGTFLLRLRHCEGTTPKPYDDEVGYFQGMNRRYQCCVRGRFKKALPFEELDSGFKLDRKFGKLPSKWVIKGALKVVSFFAPQLSIKLEGTTRPYSVTPLGSTPQCINIDDDYEIDDNYDSGTYSMDQLRDDAEYSNMKMNALEGVRVESSEARRSLLGLAVDGNSTTSLQRAKMRKKAFDKLYSQKAPLPKTDPSKVYTFEFLQHMFNFQDFSIELGNMMGSLKLQDMLDGQPLPIMASHGDQHLWSFDVWNECLWEQAKKHDALQQQQQQHQYQ